MARKATIFTGQWADMPLETLCQKMSSFGYDGLELACWGDHFDVFKAASRHPALMAQSVVMKQSMVPILG